MGDGGRCIVVQFVKSHFEDNHFVLFCFGSGRTMFVWKVMR